MSNKEKEEVIKKALEKQDVFKLKNVMNVNHKPHAFMIGPRHVEFAANNYGGALGKEAIEAAEKKGIYCAHPGCRLHYDEHLSENVAFLQTIRDVTNDEADKALKLMVDEIGKDLVDGFAFVKSEFEIK